MNSNADESNGQRPIDLVDSAPGAGEFNVFESVLSDLQPIFELTKDLSGPEAATALRGAFELFEAHSAATAGICGICGS